MRPVLFALCLLLPVAAAAQPRIVLEPEQLEFGVLQQHETRDVKVTIRNAGSETLEIRDIESTCGCTVPELQVTELAPGQSTEMDVHFNSKTFQGPQTKYIHIYSNDPARPSVDLLVTADIKVPLYMTPAKAQIGFRTLQVGETQTVTYTFRSDDVTELEIAPRTWPEGWLDVAVKPGRTPQTVLVDFVVKTDAVPGRFRDPVTLTTNVPSVPVVNLSADIKLISDLVVTPETVNLRVLRPEQPVRTRVQVAPYRPGTTFKVTDAQIDIPGLRARVESGDRETTIWLDGQSLAANDEHVAENGAVKGTLTIHTDLASSSEITVPVMYLIRN